MSSELPKPYTYAQWLEHHTKIVIPTICTKFAAIQDPNERDKRTDQFIHSLRYPDDIDHTRLFLDIRDFDRLRLLLTLGVDPDVRDSIGYAKSSYIGRRLIEIAVHNNDAALASFLVTEAHVDVLLKTMSPDGSSPLEWAEGALASTRAAAERYPDIVREELRQSFERTTGRRLGPDEEINRPPSPDYEPLHTVLAEATARQISGASPRRIVPYPKVTQRILEACWEAREVGREDEDATEEVELILEKYEDGIKAWREMLEKAASGGPASASSDER